MREGIGTQQIATQFADVLEQRAVPAQDVVPELACSESLADHHRAAADQHRAGREHAANAVIHRKGAVHPVARAGIHHAGKPVAPLHQPKMADVGGLGQPGRSRGVQEERPILDAQRPELGPAQLLARASLDVDINARERARSGAVRPDLRRARGAGQRRGEPIDELGGDDDVPGRDDTDAMREGRTDQIGIEQRHHSTDASDTEPDRHVLRLVRHQQADRLALGETLLQRPAGIPVRALGEPAIGEALALGEEGRRVAVCFGEVLDHVGEDAARMAGDRRRQLERAQPRLGSGTIAAAWCRSCRAHIAQCSMRYCRRPP